MNIRFYIDPETGRPHVENHGVTTSEAAQALERAQQDYQADRGARIALGPTAVGRILKVIYKPDKTPNAVFIITANPIQGNELKAYRRRMRRRGNG